MNPFADLIQGFQDLATQVPAAMQPVVIDLAGTIPFIEGEVSSTIGVLAAMNPVIAGVLTVVH